jgi:hypothetical protein
MKLISLPVGSLLLAVLVLGCRPERTRTSALNPHTLPFAKAGVSLVVGEEWQCRNVSSEHDLYPPTLVSQAGTIRVLLLPPDRSDPAVVADGLRADCDRNPLVAKHSFRKQQFATDTGVSGICVSYLRQADTSEGKVTVEDAHYLLKNRAGRCVAINYLASAEGSDSYPVRRMLLAGLRLE